MYSYVLLVSPTSLPYVGVVVRFITVEIGVSVKATTLDRGGLGPKT